MPTYEYACAACGHEWEQTQRITEPPLEVCPACAKATAHRLISAGTNFILKGSGWYSDLYASPKPAGDGAAKKDVPEKTDTPDKKKTEKSDASAPSASDGPAKSPSKSASTESTTATSNTPSVPST